MHSDHPASQSANLVQTRYPRSLGDPTKPLDAHETSALAFERVVGPTSLVNLMDGGLGVTHRYRLGIRCVLDVGALSGTLSDCGDADDMVDLRRTAVFERTSYLPGT